MAKMTVEMETKWCGKQYTEEKSEREREREAFYQPEPSTLCCYLPMTQTLMASRCLESEGKGAKGGGNTNSGRAESCPNFN